MIAFDTNLLVRILTRDDPAQAAAAIALLDTVNQHNPAFIAREVLIELVWVLEKAYHLSRRDIAEALEQLLVTEDFLLEAADDLAGILQNYCDNGYGFADLMILAAANRAGASQLFTFDRQMARLPGVAIPD